MTTRAPSTSPRRQGGVSIVAAIFLLLLFSALAAMMVSLTVTSSATSVQDFEGARAYQAARGGAEWGLWQVLNNPANGPPVNAAAPLPACFASPANLAAIPGYPVQVTCQQFADAQEGTRNLRHFRIVATATGTGPGGAIERQVTVTAEVCRDTASTVAPFACTP